MRATIHPNYQNAVTITCSCGNSFVSGSTKGNIHVDLCYKCHPFYTGTQKLVDTEGKVEKFSRRRQVAEQKQLEVKEKVSQAKSKAERPNSLAEMVAAIRKQQKSS